MRYYHFQVYRDRDSAFIDGTVVYARSLSEAEVDFRHYLRTHQPELLDQAINYTYTCEVRHV